MGYPNSDLIPAAILLDHPNITREEFVNLLNRTHSTWSRFPQGEKVKTPSIRGDLEGFHKGMHGLAELLCLPKRKEFLDFQGTPPQEKDSIITAPPVLTVKGFKKGREWGKPRYIVFYPRAHWSEVQQEDISKDLISRLKIPSQRIDEAYEWRDSKCDYNRYILSGHNLLYIKKRKKSDRLFLRRVVNNPDKTINFSSLEELLAKHPEFSSDFMYDFSQSSGRFRIFGDEHRDFIWKNENGRYSLDEETFRRSREGYRRNPLTLYGYTGLILTAEAIKNKAWKYLSWNGFVHKDALLKLSSSSRRRYEQAVWDSHTSLYAKSKGMAYFELMRLRLLPDSINQSENSYTD